MECYEALGLTKEALKAAKKGAKYDSKIGDENGAKNFYEDVQRYEKMLGMKPKKGKSIENKFNLILITGAFLCSLIFLSSNFTGNTILNSSIKTSNVIGALLFIVGIVVAFLYTRRK